MAQGRNPGGALSDEIVRPPDSHEVPSKSLSGARRGSAMVSWGLLGLAAIIGGLRLAGLIGDIFGGITLSGAIVPGSWMAWTWAVAVFFGAIGLILVAMTIWQGLSPEAPRVGVLRIETTPGDRLFISLIGAAFIHLAALAIFGPPLWGALAVSLVWAAAVFRWA